MLILHNIWIFVPLTDQKSQLTDMSIIKAVISLKSLTLVLAKIALSLSCLYKCMEVLESNPS